MIATRISRVEGEGIARELHPSLATLRLGAIAVALRDIGAKVEFASIDTFETGDDQASFEFVFSRISVPKGTLIVRDHYSQCHGDFLFVVESVNFREFVVSHSKEYLEPFFNVDSFVFSPSERRFVLFHHNGEYADVQIPLPSDKGLLTGLAPSAFPS